MQRVLVIDDEKGIRVSLQKILKDADYDVDVAEDADQALKLLEAQHYDVAISDIVLPQLTGMDLLEVIENASQNVQVVLITGETTVETATEAVCAGAFDYLVKPIVKERLLKVVADAARIRFLGDKCRRLEEENQHYQEKLEKIADERAAALCESEQKYRLLADNATDIIWMTDMSFSFTYISPSVERVRGLTAREAMRRPLEETVTPDSNRKLRKIFQEEMKLIESGDYPVGKTLLSELELWHKDGSTLWAEITMRFLFDDEMNPTGVLGISRDITRRKQTEQALRRAQKMDALGQLTGGIAHDFNNILGIILGNLELLRYQITDDGEALERVETIKVSAQRAADLTRQLHGFSRRQAAESSVTNLNSVIGRMKSLLARFVAPEVDVEQEFSDDLWCVDINSGEFEDALLNLSTNARDAMPGGGRLTLETRNCTLDSSFCAHNPDAEPGDYVRLTVSDTGKGMLPDQQERMFEPFYTTKADGEGAGLGLAMVFGFVQRSGGFIQVFSEPESGTAVVVFLPRAQEDAVPEESCIEQTGIGPGGDATVLVVDDERGLLDLARTSLESVGYRVLTAKNGKRALEILGEERGVAALFSDVVMSGGMNGYELAEHAMARRPNLKVLLTSGFLDETAVNRSQARFTSNLLAKPYAQSELASRLQELLVGPAQSSATSTESANDFAPSGVTALDEIHVAVEELLKNSKQVVASGSDSECEDYLTELRESLQIHFPEEEAIMAACNYPAIDNHRDVHRLLLMRFEEKMRQREVHLLSTREVLKFLTDWWTEHFQGVDRSFGFYCQNNPDIVRRALKQVGVAAKLEHS